MEVSIFGDWGRYLYDVCTGLRGRVIKKKMIGFCLCEYDSDETEREMGATNLKVLWTSFKYGLYTSKNTNARD